MLTAPTRDHYGELKGVMISGGAPCSLLPAIVEHEVPWSEKTDSRLFFRGGPSGAFPAASVL